MSQLDHIKTARSLMNYANQLATMLYTKAHKNNWDIRTDKFQDHLLNRWKPAHDRACAYAHAHNISKHQL